MMVGPHLFIFLLYSSRIDNRTLVELVREKAPSAVIIANAVSLAEVDNIYQAEADYVYIAMGTMANAKK